MNFCADAGIRSPFTGLVGNTLDVDSLTWARFDASIGAGIDSFYEYLLKVGIAVGILFCFCRTVLGQLWPAERKHCHASFFHSFGAGNTGLLTSFCPSKENGKLLCRHI